MSIEEKTEASYLSAANVEREICQRIFEQKKAVLGLLQRCDPNDPDRLQIVLRAAVISHIPLNRIGECLDVDASTVTRWARGETLPPRRRWMRYSDAICALIETDIAQGIEDKLPLRTNKSKSSEADTAKPAGM